MGAGFQLSKFVIEIKNFMSFDGFSGDGSVISNVLCFIYTAGTKTLATIYADNIQTAKTNPISRAQFTTDGKLTFWAAEGSSFDIYLNDEKGNAAFYAGVTANTHTLRLMNGDPYKHLVIPFSASNNVETDTGIVLPQDALVLPPSIEVVTTEASKTINVGLLSSQSGGNASGFIAAAPVNTAGFVMPWTTAAGNTLSAYVASSYLGSLIGIGHAGADSANAWGVAGGAGYVVGSTAVNVSYTTSANSANAAGYIHLPFRHLR